MLQYMHRSVEDPQKPKSTTSLCETMRWSMCDKVGGRRRAIILRDIKGRNVTKIRGGVGLSGACIADIALSAFMILTN
jgi:hypothetical protein